MRVLPFHAACLFSLCPAALGVDYPGRQRLCELGQRRGHGLQFAQVSHWQGGRLLIAGDTITVLDSAKVQHKIRLAGIDAPEKRQGFGEKSKQSLSALVYRQNVVVDFKKKDRYGRIVGKVLADGTDAGLEQVMAGLAWHYKAYAKEQPPSDRQRYSDEEAKARAAKRGLWADSDAMAPWDFRQR